MLFSRRKQSDPDPPPAPDAWAVHDLPDHAPAPDHEKSIAQLGVDKAEAARAYAHSNTFMLVLAWIGIGLVSYVNGLDNQTMYAYLSNATSYFGSYTTYTSVSVVQQVMIGVMKLPLARCADVFGRAQTYCIAVAFYTVGFVIVAASQNMAAIWAGVAIYATGNTGVSIMQQIVLADWVPTRYRGLSIALISLPYIINFKVAADVTKGICGQCLGINNKWRWGPGMMSILVPVSSILIISILSYSQWKARRAGLTQSFAQRWPGLIPFLKMFDIPGNLLVVAGWILFLLAINLAGGDTRLWREAHTIVMIIVGPACLVLLCLWEKYGAPEPLIRKRYLVNKDVMLPLITGVTDFFAFYTSWLNAYVWVTILTGWEVEDATYFSNAQSLSLTVFGILGGILSSLTCRYKWQMFSGAIVRTIGIGLMIRYRHEGATTAQLVIPQIIQGAGGGIMGIQLQVAAQVSVPHADVAMVTAFVLLMTEIGGAIGSAVAGAVQRTVIPDELAKQAPYLSAEQVAEVAAAPSTYLTQPDWALGTPNRSALIAAWAKYWNIMLIIAICVSAVPIICSALFTDRKLNNKQTLVDEDGKSLPGDQNSSSDDTKGADDLLVAHPATDADTSPDDDKEHPIDFASPQSEDAAHNANTKWA